MSPFRGPKGHIIPGRFQGPEGPCPFRSPAVGDVEMLKRVDSDVMLLHGGDAVGGSVGGRDCGDRGNAFEHGGTTDGFLVKERVLAARRVDDELNTIALDEIDDVGSAFFHFENTFDREAGAFEYEGCAFGGDNFESEINIAASEREWRPACRGSLTLKKTVPVVGSTWPAESCALAKASPKLPATPITSPVDFISGPRTRVDAGEFVTTERPAI